MPKEAWPLKLILGGTALVIGGGDLTFGTLTSPGVLLFVGVLLLGEGLADRRKGGSN